MRVEVVKEAVSGTTLVDNGKTSYVRRLINNLDTNNEVEHLIVQLSTNDASKNLPLGEINEVNDYNFDTSTIIGAIEFIIDYAQAVWGCDVTFYTNPYFNSKSYEAMIDALYQIQKKYDIVIVDFYNYVDMLPLDESVLKSYMSDQIHPNFLGYQWMASKFQKYLLERYESKYPGYTIPVKEY